MIPISVVIPLYNKEYYIKRAITSVLKQTLPPKEIIVVNDGSTDNGPQVVENLRYPSIRLINQGNQGVSAARNRGVEEARWDFIAFLDADDEWKPQFLEVISVLVKKFPSAGIFATGYEIIQPDGKLIEPDFKVFDNDIEEGIIENYYKVALSFPVWTSATVIPKRILLSIGGFRRCEVQGEDVELWLRIAMHYPIAFSKKHLAIYHKEAKNRAVGFQRWSDEPVISKTAREAIESGVIPESQRKYLKEYIAHFQIKAAQDLLIVGRKQKAKELLKYAKGTRRFFWQWVKLKILSLLPSKVIFLIWKIKKVYL